jgi:anti-sigma regulatory factor (Ser/Thr protein kinase)
MNVQFAIKDNQLYVLEVNPRASRTVPFVAKAIGVPLAKLAAKVMTGLKLKDLGFTREQTPKHWCVKEAVFPFVRFPGATIMLGPEMRSTGEVMGLDEDLGVAFAKAQAAAKPGLPTGGNVFLSVKDADKPRVVDIARQLEDMADLRGVRIDVAEGLPTLVADAGRLELVFVNLLANAIKYSDPAKPDRLVRVEPADDAGRAVRVRDNGIGIPEGRLALIFEQFVRVHAHLDDELGAQGLGLGLSIVRECMDAMSGAVSVQSRDGEGTTFLLTWPLPAGAVEPVAQA